MGDRDNKALARKFFDQAVNQGNLAAIDYYAAANVVDHHRDPGDPAGREGLRQALLMLHAACRDHGAAIEDIFAEGEFVTLRWTICGADAGIDLLRFREGRIVERWGTAATAVVDMPCAPRRSVASERLAATVTRRRTIRLRIRKYVTDLQPCVAWA